MNKMRVGYIQFRPVFGECAVNLVTMKRLVSSVEADLLVLPELANTGYAFTSKEELARIAEPFEGSPTLDALQALARERDCALVVGFGESDGDRLYNSSALLTPDGDRKLYRKIHLFGAENFCFTPGDIPFAVHDCRGVKLGMMICFDWFFPESMRVLALKGAQIICHPVNFVLPWGPKAMTVRSLENHVFSITANRYGAETRGTYSFSFIGQSQIVSPMGEVLSGAAAEGDSVAVMEIDPAQAQDKRLNKFNDLFDCRRPEFYGEITD
jgi:predicted amidohydrolase